MLKIKDSRPKPPDKPSVHAAGLPEGTVFTGRVDRITGTFLRIYDRVVSLEDPSATWEAELLTVENYERRDAELVLL